MREETLKRIIIFAGTNEGRSLCEFFAEHGFPVTACVATEYGSLCLSEIPKLEIKEGRLTAQEIKAVIADYDYIIDATHPYAKIISDNIVQATGELKKTYLRIIRPESKHEQVHEFETMEQACEYLNRVEGNVLVTTGSKELLPYTKIKDYAKRLFVRVLPSLQSMEECIRHGFPNSNIICMQGPFSEELNMAMLHQVKAKYLITKETGTSGGLNEKISAAVKCNAEVLLIGRPVKEEGLSLEEAYDYFTKELRFTASKNICYPIFLKLRNRRIVIIGAGQIAARRIQTLLEFEADITVLAPTICEEISSLSDRINILQKEYEENDIQDAFLVVAVTNSRQINQKIYEDAKKHNIMVNIADNKEQSDFYFPAVFQDEHILGGIISRNGENHGLVKEKAKIIRNFLAKE